MEGVYLIYRKLKWERINYRAQNISIFNLDSCKGMAQTVMALTSAIQDLSHYIFVQFPVIIYFVS